MKLETSDVELGRILEGFLYLRQINTCTLVDMKVLFNVIVGVPKILENF